MSGNTLGLLFSVTTFGESHGPAIGCVIDGCPPGLALSVEDLQPDLDRRKPGKSPHVKQRKEDDIPEIFSSVFECLATCSPNWKGAWMKCTLRTMAVSSELRGITALRMRRQKHGA